MVFCFHMKATTKPAQSSSRRKQLADIIRTSYPALRSRIRSPYVSGDEIHKALLLIGHNVSEESPDEVSNVLGWKEMGLPVANVCGEPRYYFPAADPNRKRGFASVTEQVTLFVDELRHSKITAVQY